MKKFIVLGLLVGSGAFAKEKKIETVKSPPPVVKAEVAKPADVKIGIKGMVCAFCAQGIEKSFKSQPEVAKIDVSLENKTVVVKFKDGKSLSKEKMSEILKDSGYEAVFGD